MSAKSFSSRQFNQDSSGAKKAANDGPVFITDRGNPSHVLTTIDTYIELTGGKSNIVELLAMDDVGDEEFEPVKLPSIAKPVDLD